MQCPSCGASNQDGFRFCGACGAPIVANLSPLSVQQSQLSTPPLESNQVRFFGVTVSATLAIVILACISCVLFVAYLSFSKPSLVSPTPKISETGKPSYSELCNIKSTTNLTQAQAKSYFDKLIGIQVTGWKRYVHQVDSSSLLGISWYSIYLSDNSKTDSWDTKVRTSDKSALALSKGQLWEFGGIVSDGSVVSSGVCMFYIDAD